MPDFRHCLVLWLADKLLRFEMKQITFFLLILGILFSIPHIASCTAQKPSALPPPASAEDKYAEIKAEKFLKIQVLWLGRLFATWADTCAAWVLVINKY